jgi:hypothetical protein
VGGFGHPILAVGGGSSHPDFLPFFFKKKTKIWPKKKTGQNYVVLKWTKLRRFGQNDIVLDEPKTV